MNQINQENPSGSESESLQVGDWVFVKEVDPDLVPEVGLEDYVNRLGRIEAIETDELGLDYVVLFEELEYGNDERLSFARRELEKVVDFSPEQLASLRKLHNLSNRGIPAVDEAWLRETLKLTDAQIQGLREAGVRVV